ncbi:hypothetical protein DAEQUDRAFT_765248 [Daedalea quercina L-15889]|uniref:Uncharacterized protein n=1 Tax=Daedalea quercina L-15889 TaxID=1314783 RepID=A0A165QM19_9APHY|nr:hypothetical protein DAEQUDRAFT_765248 [Daedalea quercina L-15889]
MFATFYSQSMLPIATPAPINLDCATLDEPQRGRMTIRIPPKEALVQARPKIGLRRVAFAPQPEKTTVDMPGERVELESPSPVSQAPSALESPTRVYGRPRRPAASARRWRPASPSGVSKRPITPAKRVEVFESITCTPELTAASFEELRLECYRVSYLANGHAPMPVTADSVQWDTIPPFYSPFVQEVGPSNFEPSLVDITMGDESSDPWTSTFDNVSLESNNVQTEESMEY